MNRDRLTPLDASFLDVESESAHMHVGWAATFAAPADRPRPTYERLRDHIERRLRRAPRYRQQLAHVPLGVNRPVWVDDVDLDIRRHVRRARTQSIGELADTVMSRPLAHDHPLWEIWVAERLDDGRIGIVGKAHHCMVDGIAAVELAALLLDGEPDPPLEEPDDWEPTPAPSPAQLLLDGLADRIREDLRVLSFPARVAASPARLGALAGRTRRAARALAHSLAPAPPVGMLNEPLSPNRHLAFHERSLDELRRIKRAFGVTINDVVLAVSAGAVARYLAERGHTPPRLKAMVPVNVRDGAGAAELGNRISFIFVDLPCHEPDPVRCLRTIGETTRARKAAGEPDGADAVLELVSHAPGPLQRVAAQLAASSRAFNLVVSNIPGPPLPLYLLGCELEQVYPVVPIADRHTLSIGFTSVRGGAFFGIYADRDALPDADALGDHIGAALNELLVRCEPRRQPAGVP